MMPWSCCLTFSSANMHSLNNIVMRAKWKTFCLTFLSYGLIHAVRRSLSSLKYTLNSPPSAFSPMFLGTLDMTVLVSLAIAIVVLGPKVVNQGAFVSLRNGMIFLCVFLILLGIVLLFDPTSAFPYILLYPIIGFFSFVGWPTCIYMLSLFFQKGMAFSLWFGCTQFGDVTAVLLNLIFIQVIDINSGFFIFSIVLIIILSIFLNQKYLAQSLEEISHQPELRQNEQAQRSPVEGHGDLVQQKEIQYPSQDKMTDEKKQPINLSTINFITVWTLQGVPGYILSFVFVKGVNVMISGWLVFYLSMIGMLKESNLIVLLWSASTFGGGILGIYLNRRFTKKFFLVALFISAIFFIFLEEMHLYPNEIEVIILILACGVAFGGPYTLMNTSIPLHLSQKPHIKYHPDAKTAIVSAMEGYSLLFCGLSLLIIPAIGVVHLHWVAFFFCLIAALILLREQYKQHNYKIESEREINAKDNVNKVRSDKEIDRQLSANLEGIKYSKKQRRRRRSMKSNRSIDGNMSSSKQSKQSDKQLSNREPKPEVVNSKKQSKESFPSIPSELVEGKNEPEEKEKESQVLTENMQKLEKSIHKQAVLDLQEPFIEGEVKGEGNQYKEMSENTDYLSLS